MKNSFLVCLFLLFVNSGSAQYIFKEGSLPEHISILHFAKIADAGKKELTIGQVKSGKSGLEFHKLQGIYGNLGFTSDNYWLHFDLINTLNTPLTYYLETAEPITNKVDLYLFNPLQQMEVQHSGDELDFNKRVLLFRETLFKIELAPHEKKTAFIEVKNDGEKNSLPLLLHSQSDFLNEIYHGQLIMGVFYGILLTIVVTYLFFFFALKEITFLYYSLYVFATCLCHAALDGFFHQYLVRQNNWFNLHAVLIFAIAGSYFFGKYSEIVLEIKERSKLVHYAFKVLYILFGIVLAGIIVYPGFLRYAYPLVNILTLFGMLLIVSSILYFVFKRQKVDYFYTSGISILFICFTIVILLNFGYTYNSYFLDNITKIGIALEVIALSLSMANRIRLLKSRKEELQAIALQRAREMNDTKSYFLSNMSHELRTPLNAIIGLTHLMDQEITDPRLKVNFELIKQASASLVSSVNDILDFSKIEKGELQLDKISFSPALILESVRSRFAPQAEAKGLEFNFSSSFDRQILIMGDPVRMDQLLNNVLNNAVKFTTKGRVSFTIDAITTTNGEFKLIISITDTGEGIPPEKLDTVYQMFSQLEVDNKRRFGGFGIGLCVVKALVDLHHGNINLQSVFHKGTTCTIELQYPLSIVEDKLKNVFPLDSYDLMNSHVLVVEDNPMNQMVLKMMLKKWNNTLVSFANDGAEGLTKLEQNEIDIVLMDLQMPVMDGYEAIAAIRSGQTGEKNKDIPIIAITADLMQDTKDRVFQLGVNDYLTKPVDQKLLYEKITTHLS